MPTVDSNFLFGRPHGAGLLPPSTSVHLSLTFPFRVDVINGWPLIALSLSEDNNSRTGVTLNAAGIVLCPE